LTEFSTG